MPRMTYHLVGKPIASFADCSEEMKGVFHDIFNHWAEKYTEDAKELTDEELEFAVDETVFELWNSSDPPQAPVLEKPKATEIMVQIGVFKKDLPHPKKRDPEFYDDTNNDAWTDAASKVLGKSSRYNTPPERKARQPAFVATHLDDLLQTIIHEFFDKKGRRAPATYIDFRSFDKKPQDRLMAKAYNRSDKAWVNAYADWNKQLCVYLCRRQLFNASHTEPWNDLIEGEERVYSKNHYCVAARIIQQIPSIRGRLQDRRSLGLEMKRREESRDKY